MESLPTSEDAERGDEFDTLEEWIVLTTRDRDEETSITFRPEKWQRTLAELISIEISTNKAEVYNRAFAAGLRVIRDEVGWKNLSEVFDMRLNMLHILTRCNYDKKVKSDSRNKISSIEFDVEHKPEGRLTKPVNVPVKMSVVSELEEHFSDRSNIKLSHLYRIVVGCGLSQSKFCGDEGNEYADSMVESVVEAVGESRQMVELEFLKTLSFLSTYGYDPSEIFLENAENLIEMMRSDRKEDAKKALQKVKEQ